MIFMCHVCGLLILLIHFTPSRQSNLTLTDGKSGQGSITESTLWETTEWTDSMSINVTEDGSMWNGSTQTGSVNTTEETVMSTVGHEYPERSLTRDASLYLCECDVTSFACDINCCCDKECSFGDLKAFAKCTVPKTHPDPRYCFKENIVFRNNVPHKVVETYNNLFCIYTDNFLERFNYKDQTVITNDAEFEMSLGEHADFLWSSVVERGDMFAMDTFKVGAPLYVQHDSGYIGYLVLLRGFTSGVCNENSPVSYMKDDSFSCYHLVRMLSVDCTANKRLNGNTFFDKVKVVRSAASFKNDMNSSASDFLEIRPRLCSLVQEGMEESCSHSNIPEPTYNESDGTCYNAVSKVVYYVWHNGTEGPVSIQVHLTLANIVASRTTWTQENKVVFQWASQNGTATPFKRSGNPGYNLGAPVIAGKLVTLDVEGKKTAAVRLIQDPQTWLTVMKPSTVGNGQCLWKNGSLASGVSRLAVTFGHDIRTGCSLVISLHNLTNSCSVIQSAALDSLLGWDPPDVVAAYGNPQVENLGEWVPILKENQPGSQHSVYVDSSCTNIVRELMVSILYANTGSVVNPQAKIIGVRSRFGTATQLKLHCIGQFCQSGMEHLTQTVVVTTSVNFVDVSEKAVPMYAVPPSIQVKLPHDFFYPFSESRSNMSCAFNLVLTVVSLFISTVFSSVLPT